jgi:glycosyltransferase involved in cell wall biosynthesis
MIHSTGSVLKVALVHDYIKEYGGAERVLEALTEVYPDAPIYTSFYKRNSTAYKRFENKKIIASWVQYFPFFGSKLYSPLRFLTPLIWGSFNFSKYDLVISSASWYIAKGFGSHQPSAISHKPIEICYCHTPPRWLYGYTTSINFQKYWPVKVYARIVGHFLRLYDFKQAQKVDYFIANSKEVQSRIKKFYRRDSTVIYPPVSLPKVQNIKKGDYYFIVSRIVGAKGLDLAVEAALKTGFQLKIAGSPAGYYFEHDKLVKRARSTSSGQAQNVEFLGQVTDEELAKLYKGAKAFLALSQDEDFGITPVESMLSSTPVIAFNGGGYKETVLQGRTGILFDDYSVGGLIEAIKKFESSKFNPKDCVEQAEKFSKERFKKEIKEFVEKHGR